MSDANPDALAKQLKDTLTRRRPRPVKIVLSALALSVLLLAGLAYSLYPGPRMPPLQVLALDGVVAEGEEPTARVQLYSGEQDTPPTALRRKAVVVQEPRRVTQLNDPPRLLTLMSDDTGQAATAWPIGKQPFGEFLASYVDVAQKHASVNDRGSLFVWPKDAPILFVADETVIGDELNADAASTLTKASAEGWRIVYVCLEQAGPMAFAKARQWLRRQPMLPRGPVLAPRSLLESPESAETRREVLTDLHQRFQGPKLAIVKSASNARIAHDVGVPTIVIDPGVNVEGTRSVASWAEVKVQRK